MHLTALFYYVDLFSEEEYVDSEDTSFLFLFASLSLVPVIFASSCLSLQKKTLWNMFSMLVLTNHWNSVS